MAAYKDTQPTPEQLQADCLDGEEHEHQVEQQMADALEVERLKVVYSPFYHLLVEAKEENLDEIARVMSNLLGVSKNRVLDILEQEKA